MCHRQLRIPHSVIPPSIVTVSHDLWHGYGKVKAQGCHDKNSSTFESSYFKKEVKPKYWGWTVNLGFKTGKGRRLYQFGYVINRAGGLVLTEIQGLILSMAEQRTALQIHRFIAEVKNMHGLKIRVPRAHTTECCAHPQGSGIQHSLIPQESHTAAALQPKHNLSWTLDKE